MTIARKDIVVPEEERAYHCTVRCVRRAFLCGVDAASGQDYAHRKGWVRDRLKHLSQAFALEVLGYGVMANHLHVVPRTQPGLARKS
jgi:putative transposase